MQATRDARFEALAAQNGHRFDAEIKIGGNYVSVLRRGALLPRWVSTSCRRTPRWNWT